MFHHCRHGILWIEVGPSERSHKRFGTRRLKQYGTELYDERHGVIGYLGIEIQHNDVMLSTQEIHLLRDTAGAISRGLVQPLDIDERLILRYH